MKDLKLPDIAHLHRRAEQCRKLAESILRADLREHLLGVAHDYDQIAQRFSWQETIEKCRRSRQHL
jgi:hypothetical protein